MFPSQRALDEGGLASLEEERRLAYVAITRARRTRDHPPRRQPPHLRPVDQLASRRRFVAELPKAHIEEETTMTGGESLWRAQWSERADPFAHLGPAQSMRASTRGPGWQRASRRQLQSRAAARHRSPRLRRQPRQQGPRRPRARPARVPRQVRLRHHRRDRRQQARDRLRARRPQEGARQLRQRGVTGRPRGCEPPLCVMTPCWRRTSSWNRCAYLPRLTCILPSAPMVMVVTDTTLPSRFSVSS